MMTILEAPASSAELDLSVPGPNGRALLASQEANESSARTYPRRLPVAFAEASGSYITDVDGRVYIDFLTGAGALALGHNHPGLVAAVQDQLTRLTHGLDFPTPAREEFKRNQLAMLPDTLRDDVKIHFCGPTGSDAVEAAIKPCKKATGRGGIVAFQGSYQASPEEHEPGRASSGLFRTSSCRAGGSTVHRGDWCWTFEHGTNSAIPAMPGSA
jgi:diaminobutyrate-2-oxoglutarate transaminase